MSKLQTLLNHLDFVTQRGDRYRAKCPAHGGNSKSILSIRETDDGRILIHCFHGCEPIEVLDAVGLKFTDVMPERLNHRATPQQVRKWRQDALHRDWAYFCTELVHECRIIWVAGKQIRNTEPLNDDDNAKLDLAMVRIQHIGDYFNGQR